MESQSLPDFTDQSRSLQSAARIALASCDLEFKLDATQYLAAHWQTSALQLEDSAAPLSSECAGRPLQPLLVPPRDLPKRGLGTMEGRAALLHAVAHIEFNAINLALDAVQRFRGLPPDYYTEWIKIAAEEAEHFRLMRERLRALGFDYGDFPAHNGLWEMATATADDVLARMALVPRGLETRGLDVTPGMIKRLREVGDHPSADALGVILRDEIGHVATGSRWFAYLCQQRALDPAPTYVALLRHHMKGRLPCPINFADRRRAGFDQAELDQLTRLCNQG